MSPQTKLAIRRWTIRRLRILLDFLDDRLHNAEVRLREDIAGNRGAVIRQSAPRVAPPEREIHPQAARGSETFAQWEARCSGVTSLPRKSARRRGMPARAFDLRFSTR